MVQVLSWAYAEGSLYRRIFSLNREALLSQIALLIGFAYLVGPVNFIPDQVPYFGHADEAGFLIGGVLVARHFAPRGAILRNLNGLRTILPNFFIVGAARCGTTSLFDAIGQHPDVFPCPVKEPNHFALELNERSWVVESARRRGVLIAPGLPGMTVLPRVAITPDYGAYLQLFGEWRGQRAIGEASTAYFVSPRAAEAIADIVPTARIIAVLRHPVKRAVSEMQMHEQLGRDLSASQDKKAQAIEASFYAPQVKRYLDAFPREQILFLIFEEMLSNPKETLRRVFGHIGVNPARGEDIDFTHHNQSRSVRFARLNQLLFRSGLRDVMVHILPARMRRSLAKRYYTASPPPAAPPISIDLFRADIEDTSALIEQDLSRWLV